ncbi:nuclear pore complex protein Nup153-like isoform X2 [Watersipora subatra]
MRKSSGTLPSSNQLSCESMKVREAASRYLVSAEEPLVAIVPCSQSPFGSSRRRGAAYDTSIPDAGTPSHGLGVAPQREKRRAQRRNAYKVHSETEDSDDVGSCDGTMGKRSFSLSEFAQSFNESMIESSLNSSSQLKESSFYRGKTVYGGALNRQNYKIPCSNTQRKIMKPKRKTKFSSSVTRGRQSAAQLILKSIQDSSKGNIKLAASDNHPKSLCTASSYLTFKGSPKKDAPPTESLANISKATLMANVHKQEVRQPTVGVPHHGAFGLMLQGRSSQMAVPGDAENRNGRHYSSKVSIAPPDYSSVVITDRLVDQTRESQPVQSTKTNLSVMESVCNVSSNSHTVPTMEPAVKTSGSFNTFSSPSEDCPVTKLFPKDLPAFKTLNKLDTLQTYKVLPSQAPDLIAGSSENAGKAVEGHSVDLLDSRLSSKGNVAKLPSASSAIEKGPDILRQKAVGTWSCQSCSAPNEEGSTVCAVCEARISAVSQTPILSTSVTVSQKPLTTKTQTELTNTWNCKTCLKSNDQEKPSCSSCGRHNPALLSYKLGHSMNEDAGSEGHMLGMNNTWKCNICLVPNGPRFSLCSSCGACRPGTESSLGDLDKGRQLPIYTAKRKRDEGGKSRIMLPVTKDLSAGRQTEKPATVTFSFGSLPATDTIEELSEDVPRKMKSTEVEKTVVPSSLVCSTSSDPVASTTAVTPSFSFSQSSKVSQKEYSESQVQSATPGVTVPTFSFGVKAPVDMSSSTRNVSSSSSVHEGQHAGVKRSYSSSMAPAPVFGFGKSSISTIVQPEESAITPQVEVTPFCPAQSDNKFAKGISAVGMDGASVTVSRADGESSQTAQKPTFNFGSFQANAAATSADSSQSTSSNPIFSFGTTPGVNAAAKSMFSVEVPVSSESSKPAVPILFGAAASSNTSSNKSSLGFTPTSQVTQMPINLPTFQFGDCNKPSNDGAVHLFGASQNPSNLNRAKRSGALPNTSDECQEPQSKMTGSLLPGAASGIGFSFKASSLANSQTTSASSSRSVTPNPFNSGTSASEMAGSSNESGRIIKKAVRRIKK